MRRNRLDLTAANWRKSTYSNGGGGDCLELADDIPGTVPVRDSKDPVGCSNTATAVKGHGRARTGHQLRHRVPPRGRSLPQELHP
ncbi:DUF397 domain-containing protein [Streptomyces sp. NPDC021969]|uniref:DUF397 domain-containing protein n=1 Tax=unclassified Streptomyces TaxID=2593676 RepID=UPI0033C41E15